MHRENLPHAENGQRLATFDRGEGVELRVALAEYQGRPYVSLRVWERNRSGQWWPVKGKGCSIRIGEATELAQVLRRIGADSPQFVDKRPPCRRVDRPAPSERDLAGASVSPSPVPFDELGGSRA